MKRPLLSALLLVLLAGCAGNAPRTSLASSRAGEEAADAAGAKESADAADAKESADGASAKAAPRRVGDFVVFRFSGAYRESAVTLAERVIARDGAVITVEVTLGDPSAEPRARLFRVEISDAPESRGRILSAARLEGGEAKAIEVAEYEAALGDLVLSADENEELLATEETSVEIAGKPLVCQKTTYRVRVGERRGTLSTLASDAFAWGDVGGELRTDDGRVLFKAELVRAGSAAGDAPVAAALEDEE